MMNPIKSTIVFLATFYLLFLSFYSSAQNVGINASGSAPDASALLDLNSADKGFLITRVDTADITSPAFGLMTLSPIDTCLYLFSGISWKGMGGGGFDCSCNCSNSEGNIFKCGDDYTDKRDSEKYGTIEIGSQCWMSKNLNYEASNGNSWCYDNDPAKCDSYGRLYDWNTIMNSSNSSSTNPSGVQGVCPVGWHVPSDEEWKELEMAIGMSPADANNTNFRGTNEGNALKATTFGGNNSSGFTAISSGFRVTNGASAAEGTGCYLWSATESGTSAWSRTLGSTMSGVNRLTYDKANGYSVRCIKD